MSVRKLTTGLLTVFVMLGGITRAAEWDHEPILVDPFEFEPDFQWFEPVTNLDLADMKPKKRAHNGWFATYDKLYLFASQPETSNSQRLDSQLDRGGGDRYQIGYMLPDEDTGWMFTSTRFNVNEGEQIGPTLAPQVIFFEGVPVDGQTNFTGTISSNVVQFDSYELNKTWRLEPYHYGGFLEPLIGLRFMTIDDRNRFDDFTNGVPPNFGTVTSSVADTENTMFGGQVGFRYFKFRNRFTFSSDFRVFAGGSWQTSRSQRTVRNLLLVGTEFAPLIQSRTTPVFSRNEEGFVGFDIRTELGYQVTRHLSVRAGVQLIDVATGVWRGGDGSLGLDAGNQNQDLLMAGFSFGINLNH